MNVKHYISICRPDHWIKNVFIVPGLLLYVFFRRGTPPQTGTSLRHSLQAFTPRVPDGFESVVHD